MEQRQKRHQKRLHTTRYARGTTCYRAPELLKDDARVNNKADIFALGCILYEVTTGQKLFLDDWNIREYALKGEPVFPNLWPECAPGSRLFNLGVLAQSLLEIDPFNRPSAVETADILQLIRQGKIPPVGKLNDPQGGMAVIRPPSPPRNITVAQVRRSSPTSPAQFPLMPLPQEFQSPGAKVTQEYYAQRMVLEQENQYRLGHLMRTGTLPPRPTGDLPPVKDILVALEPPNMGSQQRARQSTSSRFNDFKPFLQSLAEQEAGRRFPNELELAGLHQIAASFGGSLRHPPGGGNYSVQAYQDQLMVLQQQHILRGTTSGRNGLIVRSALPKSTHGP